MASEGVLGGYLVGELDSEPLAAWSGFAVFVEFRVEAVRTCRYDAPMLNYLLSMLNCRAEAIRLGCGVTPP